jgi:Tfp pilus assembly protein PilV
MLLRYPQLNDNSYVARHKTQVFVEGNVMYEVRMCTLPRTKLNLSRTSSIHSNMQVTNRRQRRSAVTPFATQYSIDTVDGHLSRVDSMSADRISFKSADDFISSNDPH